MEQNFSDCRVKESICPNCRKQLDAAINCCGEKEKPHSGDFSICMYCAAILCFGDDLNLCCPEKEELTTIAVEEPMVYGLLIKAQMVIQKILAEKAQKN
jgi:hypothetical protein